MSALRLWVPGNFMPTNLLLDMVRADGYYDGYAKGRGWQRSRAAGRSGAAEAARMRETTGGYALKERLPRPFCDGRAELYFVLAYAQRTKPLDADAWYLPGKAVTDGLVDARVLQSDGRGVRRTGGEVVRVGALLRILPDGMPFRTAEPGMLVVLTAVDDEPV